MKNILAILFVISFWSTLAFCQTTRREFPVLRGPYLGQNPPGDIPVLFAPGIVSRDDSFEHSAAIFSPDGDEVYWSAKINGERYFKIYFMKLINGSWTQWQVAPFSQEQDVSFNQPTFSPEGNRLYFDTYSDTWVVVRSDENWSAASIMSPKIKYDSPGATIHLQTMTNNGAAYFSIYNSNKPFGQKSVIYVSRKNSGDSEESQMLDDNINSSEAEEMAVFVAPDESYMIIEATADNRISELFISYRLVDKSWSERIQLPIARGRFPSVSPDGRYLFFLKPDSGIYWVDASFIEEFKPKEMQ